MNKPHASTATVERLIVGKAVDHLMQIYGYLKVETGDQRVLLKAGNDIDTILSAIFSSEDEEVWVFAPGKKRFVKLILGNGVDVISDYHTDLEKLLKAANALADALEA